MRVPQHVRDRIYKEASTHGFGYDTRRCVACPLPTFVAEGGDFESETVAHQIDVAVVLTAEWCSEAAAQDELRRHPPRKRRL